MHVLLWALLAFAPAAALWVEITSVPRHFCPDRDPSDTGSWR